MAQQTVCDKCKKPIDGKVFGGEDSYDRVFTQTIPANGLGDVRVGISVARTDTLDLHDHCFRELAMLALRDPEPAGID